MNDEIIGEYIGIISSNLLFSEAFSLEHPANAP